MAKWKPSDKISALSLACATIGLICGIYQYSSSENWKRSEFVAAQIKDFNSDPINKSILLMMDYDPVHVELFPDKPNAKGRYVDISFDDLVTSINKEKDFSETEFQIRQYFEHFLTSLSRLNFFLKTKAIAPEELCADFGYSVDLMTGDARQLKHDNTGVDIAPFSEAVQNYTGRWHYLDIRDFLDTIQRTCK